VLQNATVVYKNMPIYCASYVKMLCMSSIWLRCKTIRFGPNLCPT